MFPCPTTNNPNKCNYPGGKGIIKTLLFMQICFGPSHVTLLPFVLLVFVFAVFVMGRMKTFRPELNFPSPKILVQFV